MIVLLDAKTCIAFRNRKPFKGDMSKLFVPTEEGWIGYLKYERFTKSGNVILSSDFVLINPRYCTSKNQKRKDRYEHTFYPSMVLAIMLDPPPK